MALAGPWGTDGGGGAVGKRHGHYGMGGTLNPMRTRGVRIARQFFLLLLVLGLVFGWNVAAMSLVLRLIGYVGFWLFMLFKPAKGKY